MRTLIIFLYVNDLIFHSIMMHELKKEMMVEFEMTNIVLMNYFTDVEVY